MTLEGNVNVGFYLIAAHVVLALSSVRSGTRVTTATASDLIQQLRIPKNSGCQSALIFSVNRLVQFWSSIHLHVARACVTAVARR